MLHAFVQKNVRRVLLSSRSEHANGKDEDGVTSMVFSPLAFMPAEGAAAVLHEIIGSELRNEFHARVPIGHSVKLWPGGMTDTAWCGSGESRCEPDFVVRFDFEKGSPIVVIGEMKWDWYVSGKHMKTETDRQRRAVRVRYPEASQVLVTISKKLSRPALSGAVERTWIEVHVAATNLARRSPNTPQGEWGRLVAEFLEQAEQMDFQGFNPDLPSTVASQPMFWKDSA